MEHIIHHALTINKQNRQNLSCGTTYPAPVCFVFTSPHCPILLVVGVGNDVRVAVVFRIGGIVHSIVKLNRVIGNTEGTAMFE